MNTVVGQVVSNEAHKFSGHLPECDVTESAISSKANCDYWGNFSDQEKNVDPRPDALGFLTAFGQRDSHAIKLATGEPNRSRRAGTPYCRITWREIVQLAKAPAAAEKAQAQFVIPSTYAACDGRSHEAQRERGQFGMLAVDVDKGNPTFAEVSRALGAVLGPVASLIYSSSSATPDLRKWRVLIPLAEVILGADYPDTQKSLFAALEDCGIVCDPALARAGQPVFLPNVPPAKRGGDGLPQFYHSHHTPGQGLTLTLSHPIAVRREVMRAEIERERQEGAQRAEAHRTARLAYTQATGDNFDPIDHFNQHHTIADMLARYGFESDRRGKDWKSPLSESGSFSTRDFGDHWVAVSAWAANHGVGQPTKNGNYRGDAFDLFAYFEHGGDKSAAVRAYAQEVRPRPAPPSAAPAAPKVQPRYALPRGTLEAAHTAVAGAFEVWKAAVLAWATLDPQNGTDDRPPVPYAGAALVTTGVGKSTAGLVAIQDLSETLPLTGATGPIVMAVPRHDLADGFKADMQLVGVHAEVYKGRDQDDPLTPGYRMCWRHDEAREVERSGCKVEDTLCTQGGIDCPFKSTCGTQRQRKTRAAIWIVPHAVLWRDPPACIGPPAALIVDEDPSQGLFGGFDALPYKLSLDDLTSPMRGLSLYQNADFVTVADAIAKAARATTDDAGRIATEDVAATADELTRARKAAFAAMLTPNCNPLTPPKQLAEELARVSQINTRVLRLVRLLDMVRTAKDTGAKIVPGLQVYTAQTPEGDTFTAIRMRWKNELGAGWKVPTICTSATIRSELLRTVWPHMGPVAEAQAVMPHTTIRQVTNMAFGQSSIIGDVVYNQNLRRRLRHYIEHRARQFGGLVLVVAQMAVIEALGPMKGVETLHFNALSGVDRYKDARLIIQIGRTQPAPSDVEARAELILGDGIDRLPGWYEKNPAALPLADSTAGPEVLVLRGKGQAHDHGADQHPHPMAEAIRWTICEGELLQTVGRGRGVNRTSDKPLQIDILTSVPLPLPIDDAGAFSSFEPTLADMMQARGVEVIDTSAKGAFDVIAAVLADIFTTSNAARIAWNRKKTGEQRSRGHIPIVDIIRIRPRERSITAKARANGARYAPAVKVRADSWSEAVALLGRYGIAAERLAQSPVQIDMTAGRPATAESGDTARPPVLRERKRTPPLVWGNISAFPRRFISVVIFESREPRRALVIDTGMDDPPAARFLTANNGRDPPSMQPGNSTELLLIKKWTALHALDRQMSQGSHRLAVH